METGMLWFDNSSKDLEVKLKRAITHYEQKYGRKPNTCYARADTLGEKHPHVVGGIEIRETQGVLPEHFWIGES